MYKIKVELLSIAVNCDGSMLSVVIQTSNGPFVEIYDIQCFDPKTEKQVIHLSKVKLKIFYSLFNLAFSPTLNSHVQQ